VCILSLLSLIPDLYLRALYVIILRPTIGVIIGIDMGNELTKSQYLDISNSVIDLRPRYGAKLVMPFDFKLGA
jgi:hypothetical protein